MANVTIIATSSSQSLETPAAVILPPYPIGPLNYQIKCGNGTLADLVQQQYINSLNLAAAAQTLDLSSLVDPQGVPVNFTKVRRFRIRHRGQTDGQTLALSGGASNPWAAIWGAAGILTVQPSSTLNDGWLEFNAPNTNGYAVTGTSKTVKLDPGANTYFADVEIYGV